MDGRGHEAHDQQVRHAAHGSPAASEVGARAAAHDKGAGEHVTGLGVHAFAELHGNGREEYGNGNVGHDGGEDADGKAVDDEQL